jgi:hypothetical protein
LKVLVFTQFPMAARGYHAEGPRHKAFRLLGYAPFDEVDRLSMDRKGLAL